jgi:hypothetical protein
LRWRMEDGTVHFSRADLLINQQVRLASFGSYTFTGHGRKIEAVLAVPAVTLRQIKLLAPALTDDREGIVLKAALTLPEPPPRGYYLRRNAEASSGGQGQGDEEAVDTKVDALRHAGAASTIDWLEAVDWGAVVTQLGALSARGMAAQLKKSTQYTRRSAGSLDPRLLANVVGAVVHETAPRPELLPPAPPIPGVCRSWTKHTVFFSFTAVQRLFAIFTPHAIRVSELALRAALYRPSILFTSLVCGSTRTRDDL